MTFAVITVDESCGDDVHEVVRERMAERAFLHSCFPVVTPNTEPSSADGAQAPSYPLTFETTRNHQGRRHPAQESPMTMTMTMPI